MTAAKRYVTAFAIVSIAAVETGTGTAAGAAGQSILASAAEVAALKHDYPYIHFEDLADFPVPLGEPLNLKRSPHAAPDPPAATLKIPASVKALDGKPASVRGYMLPLDLERGEVSSFLLTSWTDSCHFGMVGAVNEWIMIRVPAGARVPFTQGQPVTVFGRFHVLPEWAGRELQGLYSLDAARVALH